MPQKPNLPNLLFLPGLLNDASLFQHQEVALAGLAKITMVDLTQATTIPEMAEAALAAAEGEPFILVGLSMGGYVALEIMQQAPERVRALALLDTSARPDNDEARAKREELIALAEKDLNEAIEVLLPRLSHPEHVNLPEVRGVIQSMATSLGAETFARQQRAIMGRADSRPVLANIACPTLILCGRDDVITPPEVHEEMAAAIPGAELRIIDECGHLSTLDQPEAVSAALKEWLQGLGQIDTSEAAS